MKVHVKQLLHQLLIIAILQLLYDTLLPCVLRETGGGGGWVGGGWWVGGGYHSEYSVLLWAKTWT